MNLYELLDSLNIKYDIVEHKAVFTSYEAEFIKSLIEGIGVKNLFLKNNHHEYFLILLEDSKKANLKSIAEKLNIGHLSFANETELKEILNLTRGSVTPLGLINDKEHIVKVLIDEDLKENKILVHPCINTKTLSIEINDLIELLEYLNVEYLFIKI